MAKTYRLGRARRLANALVKGLLGAGLAGGHTYLLSVPGRRSGRIYSTPVILIEDGERWCRGAGRATMLCNGSLLT